MVWMSLAQVFVDLFFGRRSKTLLTGCSLNCKHSPYASDGCC
jgi:hypothetical protein